MLRPVAFIAITLLLTTAARAQSTAVVGQNGCPGGTYSAVNSPDGTTLSILFDNFSVTSGQGSDGTLNRKFCNIQVPLHLPDGYTLGIYKVDYRGFSHLSTKQYSELFVDYALGAHNKSRSFHRKTKGPYDGDFRFTETIGAGLMKRVGCGEEAVLNISAALELNTALQPGEAMAALDSVDGAPKGGLIYYFDLKKCGQ